VYHGGKKPLIAVIEDDPALREVLDWVLSAAEYRVIAHESAEEFMRWRGLRPDCLVVDVRLPGLGGLELLARLRDVGDQIPAVVVTAFDAAATRNAAHLAGAAFLKKPFDERALIRAIENAIERALRQSAISG